MEYERTLCDLDDAGWDKRSWPHEDTHVGMRLRRLWRKLDNGDQLMLHRFEADTGDPTPHEHPQCVAAHVLGPGAYELGFVVNGVCQARMICHWPFYYEMRTEEVKHFVLPRTGPIFSIAIWTDFPEREIVPSGPLVPVDAEVLNIVKGAFHRLW